MNLWRYQILAEVEIDAPLEQVYAMASDPAIVPSYADEIIRIEELGRVSDAVVLVRSYLKIAWLTFGTLYRYHYRPPTHYSGVQAGGRFVRGFFTFRFRSCARGCIVSHTEGISSPVPLLASVVGFIYFSLLGNGDIAGELGRLKALVETRAL